MRACWCSVAILLAASTAGAAEAPVTVRLDVSGSCPAAAEVARELPAGTRAARAEADTDAPTWTLRLRRERDGLRVELDDPEGARQMWRLLAGSDCAALAAAVGAIVEGRFLELGALPPPPILAQEVAPAPAKVAPVETPAPAPAAPPALLVTPTPAPTPTPAAEPRAPSTPARARFGLGLGAGFAIDAAGGASGASADGQIDFTWVATRNLWRWRGQLSKSARQVLGPDAEMAPAQRTPLGLRLDVGPRLGPGQLWLQPAIGAALVVSDVAAAGGDQVLRMHPAATLSLTGGLRLGAGVSLRLELAGCWFPVNDRYRDAGGALLGRSPRASLSLGLGLDVALGAEKD